MPIRTVKAIRVGARINSTTTNFPDGLRHNNNEVVSVEADNVVLDLGEPLFNGNITTLSYQL